MSSFDAPPAVIARLLNRAPPVARLGLGSSNLRLRERSAEALASYVIAHADDPCEGDPDQFTLPLDA